MFLLDNKATHIVLLKQFLSIKTFIQRELKSGTW